MNILNRKGLIGLVFLIVSLVIMFIATAVLFNLFYATFRIGGSAETASMAYESLSSGIYYGIFLANQNPSIIVTKLLSINGDIVTVKVTPVAGSPYTITASSLATSRTVTVQYSGGSIRSWS